MALNDLKPHNMGCSVFLRFPTETHIVKVIAPKWPEMDLDKLRMIFFACRTYIFKNLSYSKFRSLKFKKSLYGGLLFEYSFEMH